MGILLGAVADDMTGATDLCGTLVREGMRTVQAIGVPDLELPAADAVVVALKSRTAPAAEAVADSRAALARLRELGASRFFFKVCSTFDSTPEGNIGPVADALLDDLGAERAVVCPAFPANGRTVYQGHLFVGDRLLSESPMARHPLTPMTDPDLVRFLGRQTRRRVGLVPLPVVRRGPDAIAACVRELDATYAVVDAVEDDDLRAICAGAAEGSLLVGGSGLALGLPAALGCTGAAPAPRRGEGPALVLAGSCSAATLEQVRRMAARYPAVRIDPASQTADDVEVPDGIALVYTSAPPDEVDAAAAGNAEALLAEVARRAVGAGRRRLVVAGGETSGAVMQVLGVHALAVGEEIAPGVPWMTSLDGPPLELALKSGNFGGPDFFLEAVA